MTEKNKEKVDALDLLLAQTNVDDLLILTQFMSELNKEERKTFMGFVDGVRFSKSLAM